VTFSRALPNVGQIVRKHLPELHSSDRMKEIFPNPPIAAFRRDNNLQDILVNKKHNKPFFQKPNSCAPCRSKKCAICPYVIEADTFIGVNGASYKVRNRSRANLRMLCMKFIVSVANVIFMLEKQGIRCTKDTF
jgi:hypothetical protein